MQIEIETKKLPTFLNERRTPKAWGKVGNFHMCENLGYRVIISGYALDLSIFSTRSLEVPQ